MNAFVNAQKRLLLLSRQYLRNLAHIHGVHVAVLVERIRQLRVDELVCGHAGGGKLLTDKYQRAFVDKRGIVAVVYVKAYGGDFVLASSGYGAQVL